MKKSLSKADAIALYNGANNAGKQILEKQFGKEMFVPKNIIDIVKSFADACKVKGEKPTDVCPYKNPKTDRQRAVNAFEELALVTEVLNEGNELDYADENQEKWFPYFEYDKKKKRFVFVDSYYDYTGTCASLGSRLSFFSKERSDYMGKQFEDTYNVMFGKGSKK